MNSGYNQEYFALELDTSLRLEHLDNYNGPILSDDMKNYFLSVRIFIIFMKKRILIFHYLELSLVTSDIFFENKCY